MGSSYCLSSDKKTMQNEQTLNINNVYEENLEEKKEPKMTNMEIINKNINTNDNHSNSNNTGINHRNNISNPPNINIIIGNNIQIQKKQKNNHKEKTEIIVQPNKNHKSDKSGAVGDVKKNNKKQVAITNDVIVSGNEVNPEKIYLKTKLLGSGAFGEVWLVHHKDLDRDFAMKIIKKRKKSQMTKKKY